MNLAVAFELLANVENYVNLKTLTQKERQYLLTATQVAKTATLESLKPILDVVNKPMFERFGDVDTKLINPIIVKCFNTTQKIKHSNFLESLFKWFCNKFCKRISSRDLSKAVQISRNELKTLIQKLQKN